VSATILDGEGRVANEMASVSNCLRVSIVTPCLREAETLVICIRKALAAIGESNADGEVIVAANGSTDGSEKIAHNEDARIVHITVRGYGAALPAGITAARGERVLMADADERYNFSDLPKFLGKLEAGADDRDSLSFIWACPSVVGPSHL